MITVGKFFQRFFADLGAESIDWLDLTFRLERQFAVRIPGISSFAGVETDADGALPSPD